VSLGEPLLGREWALRMPFLLAGAVHLALLLIALPRLTTSAIEAAQAAARQEEARASAEGDDPTGTDLAEEETEEVVTDGRRVVRPAPDDD